MKGFSILFPVLMLIFGSCENDDFCAEDTTPLLIIRLYDKDDPETLKEAPLIVWADQKDTIYSLSLLDSIALPLNTNQEQTVYQFSSTTLVDAIDFSYLREDLFVSESCGFISIFKNLTATSTTDNWIDRVEISNSTVENETAAHVKIYH